MSHDVLDQTENDLKTKTNRKRNKRPDKPLYHPPKSKNASAKTADLFDGSNELESIVVSDDRPPEKNSNKVKEKSPTWDSLYDDNGDVLVDLNNLGFGMVTADNLVKPKSNYSKFCEPISSTDHQTTNVLKNDHILEVYDFSPELKTRDLTTCLNFNNFKNYEISWVNDTHALVTFQSSSQASEALNKVYPIMKLRPLSQASNESKAKAKKIKESDITRKLRPETSVMTARRLVIGALGIKAHLDPEQQLAEKEKLRLAKEKKEKLLKQAKNMWNSDHS